MQKHIRVAVIGAGKLGSRHVEMYSKLPGVSLVGVCDIIEERAREAAERFKTRAFTDHRELLDQVNAASIVVPSHKHYAISKDFLKNKVHLLIEKPITTKLAEADKLLQIAKAKKCILQVGHIERFNSAFRAIKNIIHQPRFIECHRLGPYDPRIADTGVVLDLMIHDIDIVLDLIPSPIKSVDAVGAYILSKTEDIANVRIRFKNNSVCNLTASRMMQDATRKIRIFQDDAYFTIDYVNQEAVIFRKKQGRVEAQKIDITKSNSLKEELQHFIECIRSKSRPLVSGYEARRALALGLQISKKIQHDHNHYIAR